MAFRKRNVGIQSLRDLPSPTTPAPSTIPLSEAATTSQSPGPPAPGKKTPLPGARPSPVDGSHVTSTGTPSLDSLLAGHAGLVLGNLLLVEESGATDYAGILLRYYAAEGVLQDHRVHVIGAGDQWVRDLPGLATGESDKEERRKKKTSAAGDGDRMKIAWRYERFGGTNGLGELRGVFCLWYFTMAVENCCS